MVPTAIPRQQPTNQRAENENPDESPHHRPIFAPPTIEGAREKERAERTERQKQFSEVRHISPVESKMSLSELLYTINASTQTELQ
jgi:hypothetical protein